MVAALLKIRLQQVHRIINDLGIGRFLFIVLMLSGILALIFMALQPVDGAIFISAGWLTMILMLHLRRKDMLFLRTHIESHQLLLQIEYLIISIPIFAGLIYWSWYLYLLVYITLLSGIIYTRRSIKKRTLNSWFQRIVPDECFEWKSGIRSSLVFLIPLYITGIAGSGWPGTIPVVMIIIGLFILGFSEKNEPLPLLLMFEKSSNKFLLLKIKNQLKLYSITVIPLMLIFIILHSEYWYIVTAFYILNIVVQTYAVLSKYSFYQPHVVTGSQVFNILGSVSILIPFLLPLIILLGIRFYFKSVSNLNQYLYDYN